MSSNRAFIDNINRAFAQGDTTYLAAHVSDDVRWTMVGVPTIEGKEAFVKALAEMDRQRLLEMTIVNVITHGASAVVEGTMTMTDQGGVLTSYAFCDVYRLSGVKNGKIKELTAYVVETRGEG